VEPLTIALLAAKPLDDLGAKWLIGGSVASSLYGVPRATLDVDLVADLQPEQVAELAKRWSGDFLADERMILDAVVHKRSCNLIHLDSALKIDIFIAGSDPWVRQELENRRLVSIRGIGGIATLPFARAEDVLLHKLKWFQDADGVSDRQWGDILGLVRTRGESLDRSHLDRWAGHLGIPPRLLDAALDGRAKPI
jgi:hypothetical protein